MKGISKLLVSSTLAVCLAALAITYFITKPEMATEATSTESYIINDRDNVNSYLIDLNEVMKQQFDSYHIDVTVKAEDEENASQMADDFVEVVGGVKHEPEEVKGAVVDSFGVEDQQVENLEARFFYDVIGGGTQ